MLTLEELKKDIDLINEIQWDMTPEEAVKQYLVDHGIASDRLTDPKTIIRPILWSIAGTGLIISI